MEVQGRELSNLTVSRMFGFSKGIFNVGEDWKFLHFNKNIQINAACGKINMVPITFKINSRESICMLSIQVPADIYANTTWILSCWEIFKEVKESKNANPTSQLK